MNTKEAYRLMQAAQNLKPGDTVRVLRKAITNECGWPNCWAAKMDESVGKTLTVSGVNSDYSYDVVLSDGWGYPWFVLDIDARAPEVVTGDNFKFTVDRELGQVEFNELLAVLRFDTIKKLVAAIDKSPQPAVTGDELAEAYLVSSAASGFKKGDRVRVLRDPEDNELGWPTTAAEASFVGDTGVITIADADDGDFWIEFDNGFFAYFPWFVLEKLPPAKVVKTEPFDLFSPSGISRTGVLAIDNNPTSICSPEAHVRFDEPVEVLTLAQLSILLNKLRDLTNS